MAGPNSTSTETIEDLASAVADVLGAVGVVGKVEHLTRLTGGASRETHRFSVDGVGYVLQR